MLKIPVAHARAHRAEKRSGNQQRVTLVEELITDEGRELELLLLDDDTAIIDATMMVEGRRLGLPST
ncbi:MAG TPA: hypothetical protein VKA86_18720 [Candidatus Krumholzibacteria bacterium]|nr:hypothetical protein [Candidatus Krumholzibacteria bacterium]